MLSSMLIYCTVAAETAKPVDQHISLNTKKTNNSNFIWNWDRVYDPSDCTMASVARNFSCR